MLRNRFVLFKINKFSQIFDKVVYSSRGSRTVLQRSLILTVVILRAQSKTLSKNSDLPRHLWRGYVKNQPARASAQ